MLTLDKEYPLNFPIIQYARNVLAILMSPIDAQFRRWTQPTRVTLIKGLFGDLIRTRRELIAENALLRQQLIILKRHHERPVLTPQDRGLLVILASQVRHWKDALLLVKPDTLLKWHRQGFRLFWKVKSSRPTRQPRLPAEAIHLIQEMARDNHLWGAKRIRDELLKLGYQTSARTVRKYMKQTGRHVPPRRASHTWATFLKNHAPDIWACDFVQTYDLFFRTVFIFFIIELGSRRVVHFGVTRTPTDAWVAQQVREATPFGKGPKYLLRDNDKKYGAQFTHAAAQIEILKTPVQAPKANAICERFIGSVRRECLDHILILNERHLQRQIREYVAYFNHARPHQGIGGIPASDLATSVPADQQQSIVVIPILRGLHHDYRRVA